MIFFTFSIFLCTGETCTQTKVFLNSNNARIDPIFNNCPNDWVTDGSRYRILLFILCNFQALDNSRKEIIQSFGSFFIIFLNFGSFNKCYLFTGYDFVRQQWFNFFPKLFIITSIFCTQILIIFSFTFSQNCNTQVPLLIIIDFFSSLLFLRKIFLSLVLTVIALNKE